jgi:membrane protein implicated in regulation of membrane protease activity
LQGITAFFASFSWGTIALHASGIPFVFALILGLIIGAGVMVGIAKLVQLTSRLAEDGTVIIENAVGKIGTVYIPIEPGKQGKITVEIQGRLCEVDAVCFEDSQRLPTGAEVTVTGAKGDLVMVTAV